MSKTEQYSNNGTKYLLVEALLAPFHEMPHQRSTRPASTITAQKRENQVPDPFQAVKKSMKQNPDLFTRECQQLEYPAEQKQYNRLRQMSPIFAEYYEIDYGYNFCPAEIIHAKQDCHHFESVGYSDLEARAAALEESAMRPDGLSPPSTPILYLPPFHRSVSSVWRVGDEDIAAHNPRHNADRGRRCSLPASTANWSSTLQEGIETLSAMQMVGGESDCALPPHSVRRLKSLPSASTL